MAKNINKGIMTIQDAYRLPILLGMLIGVKKINVGDISNKIE